MDKNLQEIQGVCQLTATDLIGLCLYCNWELNLININLHKYLHKFFLNKLLDMSLLRVFFLNSDLW